MVQLYSSYRGVSASKSRVGRRNMKRTDIERRERELRRSEKKAEVISRKSENFKAKNTVGGYIDELFSLFFFNDDQIFNIETEEKIFELIEDVKTDVPEKNWDNVLRKAIKKTGVKEKEKAFQQLKGLF